MTACIYSLLTGLFIGSITGAVLTVCFMYGRANSYRKADRDAG